MSCFNLEIDCGNVEIQSEGALILWFKHFKCTSYTLKMVAHSLPLFLFHYIIGQGKGH